MIIFKTFLKVLNQCKIPIILYTVLLISFGGFMMSTSENSTNFVASKPDILIVLSENEEVGVTKCLLDYMRKTCNFVEVKDSEEAIEDALFYREVNYIMYLPENYRETVLNGEIPKIEIKSTGDYQASFAEMLLTRFLKVQSIYAEEITKEEELIAKIEETLNKEVEVEITSKLDTNTLSKAAFYYNFASYSIQAGTIYVICLILSSFYEEKVRKRTIVSSMNIKKHNRILLGANGIFAVCLWGLYVGMSFILVGEGMFSPQGVIYVINSFLFTICALTIAFLISNLVKSKNAINGIVNVVALGSSFLCGAFVPVEWLPDFVLKIAHVLPSYWYIRTNEQIKTIETFTIETLKPIGLNMGMILLFCVLFIVISNVVSRKKRKIG